MTAVLRRARRSITAAAIIGAALFMSGTAFAGHCPTDQVKPGAMRDDGQAAKGVSDQVLEMIELGTEKVKANGWTMRVRRLVVEVGGVVPWHSHAERPAMVFIMSGEMTEFRSNCAVPIVHRAGEITRENHEVSHRWRNTGTTAAILLSFDVVQDLNDRNM